MDKLMPDVYKKRDKLSMKSKLTKLIEHLVSERRQPLYEHVVNCIVEARDVYKGRSHEKDKMGQQVAQAFVKTVHIVQGETESAQLVARLDRLSGDESLCKANLNGIRALLLEEK